VIFLRHPLRLLLKLLGNTFKVFSYIFHFILADARFEIKSYYRPLIKNSKARLVPKSVWQTNFTNRFTLPVYANHLCNRLMAPDHEFHFLLTEERADFVREHCDQRAQSAYERLNIGAAQADLWRLLVLQKFGGVYLDIDACLVNPIAWHLAADVESVFLRTKRGDLTNYFLASTPDNPELADLIDKVVLNIESATSENIFELTGPGVFNQVLSDRSVATVNYVTVVNQGVFTNEHFQYIDKPQGKWTKEQKKISVLKPPT